MRPKKEKGKDLRIQRYLREMLTCALVAAVLLVQGCVSTYAERTGREWRPADRTTVVFPQTDKADVEQYKPKYTIGEGRLIVDDSTVMWMDDGSGIHSNEMQQIDIAEVGERTWAAIDVRKAVIPLIDAEEEGLGHMRFVDYFTTAIPFYEKQPILPTQADYADINALVEALKSDNVKKNAVTAWEKLVRIGPPAVPYLINVLDSKDDQQRIIASSALGRIGGKEAVAALIAQFREDEVRHNALSAYLALVAVGRDALPQLELATMSSDRQVVTFAGCLIRVIEGANLESREKPQANEAE